MGTAIDPEDNAEVAKSALQPTPATSSPTVSDRYSRESIGGSVFWLMLIPFVWARECKTMGMQLWPLIWLAMCFAILIGAVSLVLPRHATLLALIWIWISILVLWVLDLALTAALSLPQGHVDPMRFAGYLGGSCVLAFTAFLCLRKINRERQMPIGGPAYIARRDSTNRHGMLHAAMKLECRKRKYDESLALYRRVVAEYPSSEEAAEAKECIASLCEKGLVSDQSDISPSAERPDQ
jgi:hypothetical protein